MNSPTKLLIALFVTGLTAAGCGCSDNNSGESDAARDAGADAAPEAALADASLDASTSDAGPGSDCTVSVLPTEELVPNELYRLPPGEGENNEVYGASWNGRQVVYSEYRCPCPDPRKEEE